MSNKEQLQNEELQQQNAKFEENISTRTLPLLLTVNLNLS